MQHPTPNKVKAIIVTAWLFLLLNSFITICITKPNRKPNIIEPNISNKGITKTLITLSSLPVAITLLIATEIENTINPIASSNATTGANRQP